MRTSTIDRCFVRQEDQRPGRVIKEPRYTKLNFIVRWCQHCRGWQPHYDCALREVTIKTVCDHCNHEHYYQEEQHDQ